ncbi:hypothetical protein FGB62_420g01 [Gracilaria domingensis]|nr:hypothetical protein FGB62_420g01 [Gracilaria domingensis]
MTNPDGAESVGTDELESVSTDEHESVSTDERLPRSSDNPQLAPMPHLFGMMPLSFSSSRSSYVSKDQSASSAEWPNDDNSPRSGRLVFRSATEDVFLGEDGVTVEVWKCKYYDAAIECACPDVDCKGLVRAGHYAKYAKNGSSVSLHCNTSYDDPNRWCSAAVLKRHLKTRRSRAGGHIGQSMSEN